MKGMIVMSEKRTIKKEYAVYDKEENLLMIGTAKECAKYLELTMESFYCRVSRLRCGKVNGKNKGKIIAL